MSQHETKVTCSECSGRGSVLNYGHRDSSGQIKRKTCPGCGGLGHTWTSGGKE